MGFIVLLGRIFFSLIFILSSFTHFDDAMFQYAASHGVPFPQFLVPLSGLISVLGGLSILFGYKARYGAWLIVLFLIPVTLVMHAFWGIEDPENAIIQKIMFLKNLGLLGGALIFTYFGSGPYSVSD